MGTSVIFIDSRVAASYSTQAPTGQEWVSIDAAGDGLAQMAGYLADRRDLDSIHIVSHGSAGTLFLGTTVLNQGNISLHAGQLASLGQALAAGGDLLLYGCNVAQGASGQAFLEQLASFTGADLAASTNMTGPGALGGDWQLETRLGSIETGALALDGIVAAPLDYQWLDGSAAADSLTGGSAGDYLFGYGGNNTLLGGDGDDYLSAAEDEGNLTIPYGTPGNNRLDGGNGNDTLMAGSGDDTLLGGNGDDTLSAGEGNNRLDGGDGRDVLYGNAGSDSLDGGKGADYLYGGDGDDIYYVDDPDDAIFDSGGQDTVYVAVSGYKLPSAMENVAYVDGAQPLPYFIDNLLSGYSWGRTGASQVIEYSFVTAASDGVAGFAPYTSEQQAAVRAALAGYSAISGLQFSEVADRPSLQMRFFRDDLTSAGFKGYAGYAATTGAVHINASYGDLAPGAYGYQVLLHEIGHSLGLKHPFEAPALPSAEDTQANTVMTYNLDVATARDLGTFDLAAIHYLYGVNAGARSGNDSYTLADRYIWDGGGIDTLSAASQAQGVTLDLRPGSWIYAGSKAASLLAPGQAFIGYGSFIENAVGGSGNDRLTGNDGANMLSGGGGRDTLDGGAGSDTLAGGTGDDLYFLRNVGDRVNEAPSQGADTVYSYLASHILEANVERGRIAAGGTADLAGNGLGNILYAGTGNNVLDGGAGTDTLSYQYGVSGTTGVTVSLAVATAQATGGSGWDRLAGFENLTGSAYADRLTGNAGANIIDGGRGSDTMAGGAGNDTYYVRDTRDLVSEGASSGADKVYSYLASYLLPANVESGRIVATGTANLGGNSLNNVLYAGTGSNILDGGSGSDTVSYAYGVTGALGVSVSLAVSTAQATGGSGSDQLKGIEHLIGSSHDDLLTGSSGANSLKGELGNDLIDGGSGNDSLYGGAGNDTLTGGLGSDSFIFNTALSAAANRDTLADFASGQDRILLDDAVFAAIGSLGRLAAEDGRFYCAAGATAGHDADDRIIYDSGTGILYYDADGSGSGAAVQFALAGVNAHPLLAAGDFSIV